MGVLTWILLGVIVLVAIGLGVGVFFTGLFRGAEIVAENPTVQNASEQAKDFLNDTMDVDVNNASQQANDFVEDRINVGVIVTTDRAVYDRGEPVSITVKNTGSETQTFPDAAFGLHVENVATGKSYDPVSAQVLTNLGAAESKTITWQDDSAPAGRYVASVRTTDGPSAKVNFELK